MQVVKQIAWQWNMVDNVFEVSKSIHDKDIFCIFRTRVGALLPLRKNEQFVPT